MITFPFLLKVISFFTIFNSFQLSNGEPVGPVSPERDISFAIKDLETFQGSILIPSSFPTNGDAQISISLENFDYLPRIQCNVMKSENTSKLTWHTYFDFITSGSSPIPNQPQTSDIQCNPGQKVNFHFQNDGNNNWNVITSVNDGQQQKTVNYPIKIPMDSGNIMVETSDQLWTFGPLTMENVQFVKKGNDMSWCTENVFLKGSLAVKINGLKSSVQGGNSICHLDSVILTK